MCFLCLDILQCKGVQIDNRNSILNFHKLDEEVKPTNTVQAKTWEDPTLTKPQQQKLIHSFRSWISNNLRLAYPTQMLIVFERSAYKVLPYHNVKQ